MGLFLQIPYNQAMQRLAHWPLPVRIAGLVIILAVGMIAINAYRNDQLLQKARLAVAANDPMAALFLAQAAEVFPSRNELWEEAGYQALRHEEEDAALAYFARAQAEAVLSADGWIAYGEVYDQRGDHRQAKLVWEAAVAFDPSNAEAFRKLASVYHKEGDWDAAATALKQLIKLQPGNAEARFQLGLVLTSSAPQEAITYFVQAADLDPSFQADSDLMRRALREQLATEEAAYGAILTGQALAGVGQWRLAAENFIQAIEQDIEYAEAWAYLGEAKQRLGQGGMEELETALLLNPDSLAANIFTGLYWQRNNRPDQAVLYLGKAAELAPGNPSVLVDLGRATAEAGDLTTALAHFKDATALVPQNSRYWIALAEFTLDFEVFIAEEGLPAARRALELAPADPAVLVANGRVAYLLEDQVNARRYYEQAILVAPEYAPTYLHLGLFYLAQGDLLLAESAFSNAVEIDSHGTTGEQAQQLLDQFFPKYQDD